MSARLRALHDPRLVGRNLDFVLADLHMNFVGECDTLEELLDRSGRAGNCSKDWASWRGIG